MHDILGIETGPKPWLMPDERYSRSPRLMLVVIAPRVRGLKVARPTPRAAR
jgi:hypothetical protein